MNAAEVTQLLSDWISDQVHEVESIPSTVNGGKILWIDRPENPALGEPNAVILLNGQIIGMTLITYCYTSHRSEQ